MAAQQEVLSTPSVRFMLPSHPIELRVIISGVKSEGIKHFTLTSDDSYLEPVYLNIVKELKSIRKLSLLSFNIAFYFEEELDIKSFIPELAKSIPYVGVDISLFKQLVPSLLSNPEVLPCLSYLGVSSSISEDHFSEIIDQSINLKVVKISVFRMLNVPLINVLKNRDNIEMLILDLPSEIDNNRLKNPHVVNFFKKVLETGIQVIRLEIDNLVLTDEILKENKCSSIYIGDKCVTEGTPLPDSNREYLEILLSSKY